MMPVVAGMRAKKKATPAEPPPLTDVDLTSHTDVERLTVDLQDRNRITFLQDSRGATKEQCLVELLDIIAQRKRDNAPPPSGLIGVASEQDYVRRIKDGSEFVTVLENNVYEHSILSLDTTGFDYASDIIVSVHLDREYTKKGLPDTAKGDIEVFFECCRFCVYSTGLDFKKAMDGSYVGVARLVHFPNIIPIRHTTWSGPSWIKVRENGRIISQVDIHSWNILVSRLADTHYFMTPGKMPVCVTLGLAMFDRDLFIGTVPEQFMHRYTSKKKIKDMKKRIDDGGNIPVDDTAEHLQDKQTVNSPGARNANSHGESHGQDVGDAQKALSQLATT
jgi:hypothetical protein